MQRFRRKKKKVFRRKNFADSAIRIAFYPTGGMGDYIISSKLIDELLEYGADSVDVYCEKPGFGKSIYEGRASVRVLEYNRFDLNRHLYDAALKVEHFVHVLNIDEQKLEMLASRLHEHLIYISRNWDDLYVNIGDQWWREKIRFDQCRQLGLDRWTELRMGKAFRIADHRTGIPMKQSYWEQWVDSDIGNARYVTMNCGADQMQKGKTQLKVWPIKYYEKLIGLIKETDPDIQIVQLGGKNDTKMEGADHYYLGKDFELTKWIIKGSVCHIDGEGGLVHLAVQMSTPCVVIFGPTPVHMYGYRQNTNLFDLKCHSCMGLSKDWAYECFRGKTTDLCMEKITPETVLENLNQILAEKRERKQYQADNTSNGVIRGKIAIAGRISEELINRIDFQASEIVYFYDSDMSQYRELCKADRQIECRYSTVYNIAYDEDAFDYVLCASNAERSLFIDELERICKDKGSIILKGNHENG